MVIPLTHSGDLKNFDLDLKHNWNHSKFFNSSISFLLWAITFNWCS